LRIASAMDEYKRPDKKMLHRNSMYEGISKLKELPERIDKL